MVKNLPEHVHKFLLVLWLSYLQMSELYVFSFEMTMSSLSIYLVGLNLNPFTPVIIWTNQVEFFL